MPRPSNERVPRLWLEETEDRKLKKIVQDLLGLSEDIKSLDFVHYLRPPSSRLGPPVQASHIRIDSVRHRNLDAYFTYPL